MLSHVYKDKTKMAWRLEHEAYANEHSVEDAYPLLRIEDMLV